MSLLLWFFVSSLSSSSLLLGLTPPCGPLAPGKARPISQVASSDRIWSQVWPPPFAPFPRDF
eukprot:332173-Chlamydomonas_euryale.AAC.2